MQVNCAKCSQPIALTDIIESDNGRLSHVDCQRLQVLTWEERGLIFLYCSDHAVAECPGCDVKYRYTELAADVLGGSRTNLCPRCRRDLTEAVRAHLFRCAMQPSAVQRWAQVVRQAAQGLVKKRQQFHDGPEDQIREAEATLFECQRALREAMSRRTAS
jgi:hypothetical protein